MADQCGYDVTVGAFILGGPMLELLRRSGLKTVSLLTQEAGELGGTEFGLLWGHHAPVLDYLILQIGVEAERVVCRSLSPYEPLEAPLEYLADGLLRIQSWPNDRMAVLLPAVWQRLNKAGELPPINAEWLTRSRMMRPRTQEEPTNVGS